MRSSMSCALLFPDAFECFAGQIYWDLQTKAGASTVSEPAKCIACAAHLCLQGS